MRMSMLPVGITVAGLSLFGAGLAVAQPPASVRVVVSRAQILSRPSAGGNVVSLADVGSILQVLDGDGQWYWVSLPTDANGGRSRGWVRATDVQLLVAAIPPSVENLRTATTQRERKQRQSDIKARRIEKAQRELARRQSAFVPSARSIPTG